MFAKFKWFLMFSSLDSFILVWWAKTGWVTVLEKLRDCHPKNRRVHFRTAKIIIREFYVLRHVPGKIEMGSLKTVIKTMSWDNGDLERNFATRFLLSSLTYPRNLWKLITYEVCHEVDYALDYHKILTEYSASLHGTCRNLYGGVINSDKRLIFSEYQIIFLV